MKDDLRHAPVITLTGPRQSGKSTLLKHMLPKWRYLNLEEPSVQEFATSDPKGFLKTYSEHVVIDEIQRAPALLSQMQVEVDKDRSPGRFAVTGSHNLLLLEKVSQTLAGRTRIRHLLPFSFDELARTSRAPNTLEDAIFSGGYPPVIEDSEEARPWLDSYIQTYIERDVRMIRNVSDLTQFRRFCRVVGARAGQELDLSGIGNDVGLAHNTSRSWLSVLETGFIAFRLEPFHNNYAKRIIKAPKVFFYDTGLLCRMLDIRSPSDLQIHPFRGRLFENLIVAETLKRQLHSGLQPNVFFWRDQKHEIDLLVPGRGKAIAAIECKSAATPVGEFMDGPLYFQTIAKNASVSPMVVFGGDESQKRSKGEFLDWRAYLTRQVLG